MIRLHDSLYHIYIFISLKCLVNHIYFTSDTILDQENIQLGFFLLLL